MRNSSAFLLFAGAELLALCGAFGHAALTRAGAEAALGRVSGVVRTLRLTDLALFTEARYTRNPALADRTTPFQDHPAALEHFPSGSLVPPPRSPDLR